MSTFGKIFDQPGAIFLKGEERRISSIGRNTLHHGKCCSARIFKQEKEVTCKQAAVWVSIWFHRHRLGIIKVARRYRCDQHRRGFNER